MTRKTWRDAVNRLHELKKVALSSARNGDREQWSFVFNAAIVLCEKLRDMGWAPPDNVFMPAGDSIVIAVRLDERHPKDVNTMFRCAVDEPPGDPAKIVPSWLELQIDREGRVDIVRYVKEDLDERSS